MHTVLTILAVWLAASAVTGIAWSIALAPRRRATRRDGER